VKSLRLTFICCVVTLFSQAATVAQQQATTSDQHEAEPVPTSPLLDAVGPVQRKVLESVFVIHCLTRTGTGFFVESGFVVTNAHVIAGCAADSVLATSIHGKTIRFTKAISDKDRDLALLVPIDKLTGGLQLGKDNTVKVGENVTTWGFPLIYTSGAPLLSVGYVAGFNDDVENQKHTKHIVVNGAFNPGNSGGPVFKANDNKVIGVVVWKQRLTSQTVPTVIDGLNNAKVGLGGTFTRRLPDGQVVGVSNEQAIAAVLEEFYNLVQVMIGEAIAVSDLQAFINENSSELK
jgi:S1-C subfamily serine protease